MPSFWQVATFVIVVLLVAGEFLWLDATPSNFETNVWAKRQNSTINANSNTEWQGQPTTPWPALGARKSYSPQSNGNKPDQHHIQNTNEGILLSYGPTPRGNVGQNKGSSKVIGSGNVGIDLSYGLGYNNQNNQNNSGTKQNVNSSTAGQNYAIATQRQNSNKQTDSNGRVTWVTPVVPNKRSPESSPSINYNQRPVLQMANSQNRSAYFNNIQQSKTMTGSVLQTRNQSKVVVDEDEELRQFSETLLQKDVNNVGKYVTINYQGKTTSRSPVDQAPLPLLSIHKDAYNTGNIANLLALHNNYILETNVNEHVSAQEKIEENTLLDSLLSTSVMQHTRNFLIQKGVIDKDPKAFKDKLKEMWFNMYSRGKGKIGSSGFEHVFLAEIKGEDISGLHNWLYFHDAEANNDANYLGYLKKFELKNNKGAILKYHFVLHGKDKPVGSMFIGTSPELEIALYSTCFLLKPNKVCPLRFDGKNFIIRTYTFRYRGKNMIGSAFPEI